jgi:hypothetical protein
MTFDFRLLTFDFQYIKIKFRILNLNHYGNIRLDHYDSDFSCLVGIVLWEVKHKTDCSL